MIALLRPYPALLLTSFMSQPAPLPIDPAELPALAMATMKKAKFPMLATLEGAAAVQRAAE